MRVREFTDQIQELGEIMSDKEMTTIVLNALLRNGKNLHQASMEIRKPPHLVNFGHYVILKEKINVASNE